MRFGTGCMENLELLNNITAVDDDPFFLQFIEDKFEEVGIKSIGQYDCPQQGLDYLCLGSTINDIVLVDLQMPKIDGIAFLKFLGDMKYQGQVIVISGFESKVLQMAESIAKQHDLAILGQLTKPFSTTQLIGLLDKATARVMSDKTAGNPLAETIFDAETFEISKQTFFPVIQPKVAMGNERIVGYEILSRLKSFDGTIIYPNQFIRLFENNGRITEFNKVLFDCSFEKMAEYKDVNFSINLSMKDLTSHQFVDEIDGLLKKYEIEPNRLTIELTESCIVDNLLVAQEITTRLRLLGCAVSIDDYGTGYSTMKQLTEFPFQELKVDRQYIADCHINIENQAIIKSVVEMARALGLTVIAEGVETKQELAFVKEAGIEVVQGYYYSKPYVWA